MNDFDRFDYRVLSFIAFILAGIVGVVVLGNNVGVQIESYTPEEIARTDSTIRIRFYNEIVPETAETRFKVNPPLEGSFRWNGARELVFEPQNPLVSGETYTVTLQEGIEAQGQSAVLREDFSFQFQIRLPRITYLAPASAQDRNLYLRDLTTEEVFQLTQTQNGIADYSVSPDGELIAYTLYREDGLSDIWLYGLATGSSSQLTNCVNSLCGAPEWKADGSEIAYEREEYDSVFGQAGARRIWRVSTQTAQSTLLFEDTQLTGHSPTYPPSGNRIAFFSTNPPGVMIYDFVSEGQVFIESLQGVVGTFSADGTQLLYPILVRGAVGSQFYTQLEMVDLEQNQRKVVTGLSSETAIEDTNGTWRPNYPTQIAVSRRYFDDRYTEGYQVYLVDIETQEATPLVVDENYTHGSLVWSPDGNLLAMQRFNRVEQGARPQIWLYNMQTQALVMIAEDAFLPSFVP